MNARKVTRKPMVDREAFDALLAAYGGIQSFAAEVEHGRKAVWAWRAGNHAPSIIVMRAINQLAARQKIAPPYPEAVADTRVRSMVRAEVLDEAIEAVRAAPGGTLTGSDCMRILADLKTRAAS